VSSMFVRSNYIMLRLVQSVTLVYMRVWQCVCVCVCVVMPMLVSEVLVGSLGAGCDDKR
jgi:hypothetical protein